MIVQKSQISSVCSPPRRFKREMATNNSKQVRSQCIEKALLIIKMLALAYSDSHLFPVFQTTYRVWWYLLTYLQSTHRIALWRLNIHKQWDSVHTRYVSNCTMSFLHKIYGDHPLSVIALSKWWKTYISHYFWSSHHVSTWPTYDSIYSVCRVKKCVFRKPTKTNHSSVHSCTPLRHTVRSSNQLLSVPSKKCISSWCLPSIS